MPQRDERILVVDDNPRNLLICEKLLREYRVSTARSGEEALEVAVREQPDLVLLDIMMPGIDGYETCRRLRQLETLASPPKIIMVSAKAMVSERLQGYEAGADDYVTKPFNPEELLAKARVYLRLKSVEEVDRMRGQLITLLHHETRTPLTYLLSAVELLSEQKDINESQRELVTLVSRASRRLHDLLERVVLLSQMRSGAYDCQPMSLRLNEQLEAAVRKHGALAAEHDVALEWIPGPAVYANVDARFRELVIDALVDNAVRHTGSGTIVTCQAKLADGALQIEIHDNGRGIDPVLLRSLGSGFTVRDISHHRSGAGLGLAIARSLMALHGGALEIESTPGVGTTARVRLRGWSQPVPARVSPVEV